MTIAADIQDPGAMNGAPVHGSDGAKLGKVHAIHHDNDTNEPEWAAVKSGSFGGHVSLVPRQRGDWDGSTLTVPFDKDAPTGDQDGDRTRQPTADGDRRDRSGDAGNQGRDTSGPTTDHAMTVPVERVRLGSATVTDQQHFDETVRKEVIDTESTDGVDVDDARGSENR